MRVLILLALLLLLDVRAVTAVALRALIDVGLGCGSKCVLRPVLLLTRKDALVEELCVLPGVEGVVAHVLAVVRSWGATLAARLALLGTGLVADAIVVRYVVDGLELFHLVDGVIVQIVLVVANWIALVKVVLRDAASVLVVIGASAGHVGDRHTVGARAFGVESAARQGERQGLVEVAG